MNRSLVLMALNGFLTVLSMSTFCLFIFYLKNNMKEGYVFLRPAIALTVLWVGDAFYKGPLWYTRQLINIGIPMEVPDETVIIGGSITIVAYLCVIRVFSPARWGHKSWIYAFLFASIFTATSLGFTYWENNR